MKNVKLMILGYVIGILIHGCDTVIGSNDQIQSYETELGSTPWNPVYVKVVE